MYIFESLCCTLETNTKLWINYGGGLFAKSCLTLRNPWTITLQTVHGISNLKSENLGSSIIKHKTSYCMIQKFHSRVYTPQRMEKQVFK